MNGLTIREIIDKVTNGQIRVPVFQRGFVWDPEMVAFFMDSIYKKYPFGSLLFWRTREPLRTERNIGPFELRKGDPDYPIDYVLDGQQRVTSIFGVFQTELEPKKDAEWTNIYFDFTADPSAQETQFVALEDSEADPDRYFALKHLFNTTAYRKATLSFDEGLAERIDSLQSVFKEAILPLQVTSTEDRATVAIIFERVNRTGVPLDTLQLLSAWTWSDDFALQEKFEDLTEELEPFGFRAVGEDTNLLLRCCAAVIAQDASPNTLVNLNGSVVRDRFQEVANGVKGAIDFLRHNLKVSSIDNLPYTTVLVPLTVFFAVPGEQQVQSTHQQRKALLRWFWRSCFSRRYSSGVLRNLKADILQMIELKNRTPNTLGDFQVQLKSDFFSSSAFRTNNVNTKTFVLLLAQQSPRSFVSGESVSLGQVLKEYNRNEFHHLYPRRYLREVGTGPYTENCLSNFCFLSKSDNNVLGGLPPSQYRDKMPPNVTEILNHAMCPDSLFEDNYTKFIEQRSEWLTKEALELIQ